MSEVAQAGVPIGTIHVVRRYGPVGGMERYVWELTRALAASGYPVTVVCERRHAERPRGIEVHELGELAPRPRWLSLLRCSRRVAAWLRAQPQIGALIHSHERLGVHHVTTFHGPPFATIRERGWWRRVSLRVAMQLHLEHRELFAPSVRAVVPNSLLIQRQLEQYYPSVAARLVAPIPPGVGRIPLRAVRPVPTDGGVVGFIGKEWKRKGLRHAARVVAELERRRPQLQFWVAGPGADEVAPLLAQCGDSARLIGWTERPFELYRQLDLLLHPAASEPYGMVVAEALAARVPVVISSACGIASDLSAGDGAVLALDAPLADWVDACDRQLSRSEPPLPWPRSWQDVAADYARLYATLAAELAPVHS